MKKGVTRLVFKIGNYVIKIPNFTYSHKNFLDDSCVLSDGITYLKRNIIPINDIPIESDLIKAHRIKDLEIPYFDKDEKSKSTWVTLYVYVNVENGNVVNVKIK